MSSQAAKRGLALCGDFTDVAGWAELLKVTAVRATLFPTPVSLLDGLATWKLLQQAGFGLGNGTLLDAALEDGRLPLWTPEMIESALAEADSLLEQEFAVRNPIVAIPLGSPRCVGGAEYLAKISRKRLLIESRWVPEALSGGHQVISAQDLTKFDRESLSLWLAGASEEAARIEVNQASAELLTAILTTPEPEWQTLETLSTSMRKRQRSGPKSPER